MKKDEQWYLDNLPCIKQLENRVKNIKKSIAEYTGLSTNSMIFSGIIPARTPWASTAL